MYFTVGITEWAAPQCPQWTTHPWSDKQVKRFSIFMFYHRLYISLCSLWILPYKNVHGSGIKESTIANQVTGTVSLQDSAVD